MLIQKKNTQNTKKLFKRLALIVGIAGVTTFISFPVLAKFYPPLALFQPSAYRSYPSYRNSEKNIADTLAEDSKFTNFVYELKQAGLLDELKQEGPFTIFAPSDEAFNALSKDVYQRYNQPENRLKVLKYHLVSRLITEKNLNGAEIRTAEGKSVKVTVGSDGIVKLNNAVGKPPSIQTKNGVIVEIDRLLLPPEF
ncbi:fasciclin domain-containing protein [Scytonema sp. UIC 10036]|uniref:fasciclin domain-containing protein n=1 Tax=Scytonema sp. UIC 10036 TaxID=2304196 RepID=UPI0012DA7D2B|nr:fasciclin domain-containing protein [Scytonema sp. UIC 10036]MUG92419.1 fasciclin domain-containing protein [Scytonema sp. UIC 10036]